MKGIARCFCFLLTGFYTALLIKGTSHEWVAWALGGLIGICAMYGWEKE